MVLSYFSYGWLVRYLAHIISCVAPSWYFHVHSSQLICVMAVMLFLGKEIFVFLSFISIQAPLYNGHLLVADNVLEPIVPAAERFHFILKLFWNMDII